MSHGRSIMAAVGGAALALALVIAPATSASAAGSKSWNYSCSDGFLMKSYGRHTVGHYRNGALIVAWNNTVSTWRSTTFTGAPGTGTVYASYALYNSSGNCVNFA